MFPECPSFDTLKSDLCRVRTNALSPTCVWGGARDQLHQTKKLCITFICAHNPSPSGHPAADMMLQLSNGRALRQSAVSSRSAVSLKVSRDRNGHRWCASRVPKLNRNLSLSRISQPVRAVSIKAAAEDVEVTNNGAVGAAQASNMLDFEELSDIVRCAVRPAAAIMGFHWACLMARARSHVMQLQGCRIRPDPAPSP
jgi:hypothetical protein